jgi:phosphoribosyl 1,2-cyclic phosphate phosphodiesterase
MSIKVTILGCGGAGGVPSISDGWGQCNPANPRNNRRRSSILVQDGQSTVLVDASPDIRAQLLDVGVNRLDGVLFTHGHADHIHGLDELREINRVIKAPLPVWAEADTLKVLETRFGYAFEGIKPGEGFYRPWLMPNLVDMSVGFMVRTLKVQPFPLDHGHGITTGYKFGDSVAYTTDLLDLTPQARMHLKNLNVWIIGSFTDAPHPTHAHLDKVLGWIDELRPRRAVITHMGPRLDFDAVNAKCPIGATAAYDGMVVAG